MVSGVGEGAGAGAGLMAGVGVAGDDEVEGVLAGVAGGSVVPGPPTTAGAGAGAGGVGGSGSGGGVVPLVGGGGGGGGGTGGFGGGGTTARTDSMRAHALVTAAAPSICALFWAEMALYMPMPTVSDMTALSIAWVCEGAVLTVKNWASRTESVIWLLVINKAEVED